MVFLHAGCKTHLLRSIFAITENGLLIKRLAPEINRLLHRSFSRGSVFKKEEAMKMEDTDNQVLLESVNGKGIITLNRPKALNALNLTMVRQITPALQEWGRSQKMVIIKGKGGKAFCAGGDIREVTESAKAGGTLHQEFFREEYILNNIIGSLRIPYIALIDGITMGGGVGLSVHGRYRVATEKTVFAMPETAIGLFPDVGGSYFLPRLEGELGLYLALTGYRLVGSDVHQAGIATHICSKELLDFLEQDLIGLGENECNLEGIEKVLSHYGEKCPEAKKPFTLANNMQAINRLFSGSTIEDIIQDLEKDNSDWAKSQLATLRKMSPTSLKNTVKLLRKCRRLPLSECLTFEYRMSQRCCETHDFIEGVRALLVDKDKNPKWNPARIEDVSDSYSDTFFCSSKK